MAIPQITTKVAEQKLGVGTTKYAAIVGPASSGLFVPRLQTGTDSARTSYGGGTSLDAIGAGLSVTTLPVLFCRAETTTPGSMGSIDVTGVTGTAVIAAGPSEPLDDFEVEIEIETGGTVGTDGIRYLSSLDGGRRVLPLRALGISSILSVESGVDFELLPTPAQQTAFIALVADARTKTLAHYNDDITSHNSVDAAAIAVITLPAPTTVAEALAVMAQLQTAHALHVANAVVHNAADAVNVLTLGAPAYATEGLYAANEYRTVFNAHLGTAAPVHNAADGANVILLPALTYPTLVTGDRWTVRTSVAQSTDLQIVAALDKLLASNYTWRSVLVTQPIKTQAEALTIKAWWDAAFGDNKFKKLFVAFRLPLIGESWPDYLQAFKDVFDAVECIGMFPSIGGVKFDSQGTAGRTYRRPPAWLACFQHELLGPDIDLAWPNDGANRLPLNGTILDANNNPDDHDEAVDAGGDDARAITLRTLESYTGTFFGGGRALAAPGSDFLELRAWSLLSDVLTIVIPYLEGQYKVKLEVNEETGQPTEGSAKALAKQAISRVNKAMTEKKQIQSVRVEIDRSVNMKSNPPPKIPVTVTAVLYGYADGFAVTAQIG